MLKNKLVVAGFCFVILVAIVFIFFNKREEVPVINPQIKASLKIGYLTDLHCYSKLDSDANKWEVNWRCVQPMMNFTNKMNEEFFPDAVVDGGDLVDGRDGQEKNLYPVALEMFEGILAPSYHILGNHETRGFLKSKWLEFTGYKKPYYYKDIKNYRLIFLDGNNKPGIGETTPDIHYYPGHLEEEQRNWLEQALKGSGDKDVLVFVHQPPLEKTLIKDSKELFVNGREIRQLFSKYNVHSVFSGHIEEMCYIKDEGVNYYTLPGVHKDNRQLLEEDQMKDRGLFYEIVIDNSGELKLKAFHKEKEAEEYKTFVVDEQTAECNNQSVQNPQKYEALVEEEILEEENEEKN